MHFQSMYTIVFLAQNYLLHIFHHIVRKVYVFIVFLIVTNASEDKRKNKQHEVHLVVSIDDVVSRELMLTGIKVQRRSWTFLNSLDYIK